MSKKQILLTIFSFAIIFSLYSSKSFAFFGPSVLGDNSNRNKLSDEENSDSDVNEVDDVNEDANEVDDVNDDDTDKNYRGGIMEEIKRMREEKLQEIKQQRETKREELKAKIQLFKDQKKAEAIERINGNIVKINQNTTDKFRDALIRLSEALTKLEARANEKEADGVDITAVTNAISVARASISTAQSAVDAQEQKVYEVTVSTEEKAKMEVSPVVEEFRTDIKGVRDLIKDAKESVVFAITQLTGEVEDDTEEEDLEQ